MGGHGFEAQVLSDSDLGQYDCLAREHGSVFNTVTWTDLFGDSLTRYGIYDAGGALRGGFCLFREKRLGLTVLTNPPGTPSIGPFFESRAQHPAARLQERRDDGNHGPGAPGDRYHRAQLPFLDLQGEMARMAQTAQ